MSDVQKIDYSFEQTGPACVISSYAIVIHYFSRISIGDIFKSYCKHMEIPPMSKKEREIKINESYHGYCKPIDMRGFDYICQLHNNDEIDTMKYCSIIDHQTSKKPLDKTIIDNAKTSLINEDKLMMISYEISNSNFHAVVIGWSNEKIFCKDPNERKPFVIDDTFFNKSISEYIIFGNRG